jgi:hypothetical protein
MPVWNAPSGRTPRGAGVGLKSKATLWRESYVAGATNTGNLTATVGDKLVLNWHGTPTQRDGVLQMFPVIRDKSMPGVELGNCADAMIASIHDDGMSSGQMERAAGFAHDDAPEAKIRTALCRERH